MYSTVSEIYHMFQSEGLTLLTSNSTLSNPVTRCAILDYEYEESLMEKYVYVQFQKNQLILTSFLYAKENEFLISKAIKCLKQRGCSGLIVRNVFHIAIRENIIRYADSMNFPIFVLKNPNIFFEDIIIAVHEMNKDYNSIHAFENKINNLLAHPEDTKLQLTTMTNINPSYNSDLITVYFKGKKEFTEKIYFGIIKRFKESNILKNSDSIFYYNNGFMIICTRQIFQSKSIDSLISLFLEVLSEDCSNFYIGVSSIYHSINDLRNSILESLYSSSFHSEIHKDYVMYKDLGIYQVIIPYAKDKVMKNFLYQYLYPLRDHDAEYQTNLFETILEYVRNHGNVLETAKFFNQHKNSVRYRLNKISQVLNCNIFDKENYEKILIAVKIHNCRNLMNIKNNY